MSSSAPDTPHSNAQLARMLAESYREIEKMRTAPSGDLHARISHLEQERENLRHDLSRAERERDDARERLDAIRGHWDKARREMDWFVGSASSSSGNQPPPPLHIPPPHQQPPPPPPPPPHAVNHRKRERSVDFPPLEQPSKKARQQQQEPKFYTYEPAGNPYPTYAGLPVSAGPSGSPSRPPPPPPPAPLPPQVHIPATPPQPARTYPSHNEQGQRICRSCGQPGRYKEDKCVEKWGPGPLGPGTVCDRCRKKTKRLERRDSLATPMSHAPSAMPIVIPNPSSQAVAPPPPPPQRPRTNSASTHTHGRHEQEQDQDQDADGEPEIDELAEGDEAAGPVDNEEDDLLDAVDASERAAR
ncbi:hypothetical protein CYLTODRAFT_487946 [Cylindrobasidium torrendii FP15055 ss-10]|uniref:Uncharacterized protein n=1 Tax=Cylindrobasidium torrendii FP15055 ss-10 TaxID=1314674 RepID=A0A0D7BM38_9AGAR|nr:hypothetical protein CYLTODRAFT_487946 [Cylindrobasidium torrendii FP15055 ss-10]